MCYSFYLTQLIISSYFFFRYFIPHSFTSDNKSCHSIPWQHKLTSLTPLDHSYLPWHTILTWMWKWMVLYQISLEINKETIKACKTEFNLMKFLIQLACETEITRVLIKKLSAISWVFVPMVWHGHDLTAYCITQVIVENWT